VTTQPVVRAGGETGALVWGCAIIASTVDAVLLELRRDFFTGGFLAVDSATRWSDRAAFAAGSLTADAACAALGVIVALLLASRMRLGRLARVALAIVLGLLPLLAASLLQYRVFAHLGDAFDFSLVFDLAGRRPAEVIAVAGGHAVWPLLGSAIVMAALVLGIVVVQRWHPHGVRQVHTTRLLRVWVLGALVAAGLTTVMRTGSDVLDNGLRRKPSGQALGYVVTWASDVDRDGAGLLSRPGDPAPFDARVYPYAIDIPGNGIDENGVAGDLPVEGEQASTVARETPRFVRRPHVVLVMLETFRADLLGSREGGHAVTPVLDALAAEGSAAQLAYSHNGYTVQSRFHLFAGGLVVGSAPGMLLDDFRLNGYETAYFAAQDESFGGEAYDVGASRADVFHDARQDRARRYTTFATAGSLGISADVLQERVDAFLATRESSRPLFLYVNFYDTHFPYRHAGVAPTVSDVVLAPSEVVPSRADELRSMYRNTAAHVDRAIGTLLERVAGHLGESPAVIVLADHGESLFDEGFLGHGYAINEAQTRIPLVVRGLPVQACEPIGQADVRQAITDALSVPGRDGRPAFRACDGHQVFQYLGTLERPRQIAWTSATRRVIYDFREQRARVGDGAWQPIAHLEGRQRDDVIALVRYWERLRLSQASRAAGAGRS
jgi:arylsulfatase A-like enzyme